MKIALYGATGMIGQRIASEALSRGHQVTAIVRDISKVTIQDPNLNVITGDILDAGSVTRLIEGHDAVVSAFSPRGGSDSMYLDVVKILIGSLTAAGIKRLLLVGGAGSLEVAPGVQLVDTPEFPAEYHARASAQRDELNYIRENGGELQWTYFSPAMIIAPGERTGKFRLGSDQLVKNEQGESRISAEDYAAAVVDELENPQHLRQRFTIGY